jgi:hypothetical protein
MRPLAEQPKQTLPSHLLVGLAVLMAIVIHLGTI